MSRRSSDPDMNQAKSILINFCLFNFFDLFVACLATRWQLGGIRLATGTTLGGCATTRRPRCSLDKYSLSRLVLHTDTQAAMLARRVLALSPSLAKQTHRLRCLPDEYSLSRLILKYERTGRPF